MSDLPRMMIGRKISTAGLQFTVGCRWVGLVVGLHHLCPFTFMEGSLECFFQAD